MFRGHTAAIACMATSADHVWLATTSEDRSAREAIRGLVVTLARFSGFEAKASTGVGAADHASYRAAVETMETVYRDPRGGVAW